MFSGKQLDKWEGSFFILWCNHLTENFTGGSSIQEEQKQNPAILDVSHKVIGVSLFAHTDTHTCKSNTHRHKHTHPMAHAQKQKRKFSVNELNNTWHILIYFYYTLPFFVTTSPRFSLPGRLTTAHEWRKMYTHTHSCVRAEGERRRRELFCN